MNKALYIHQAEAHLKIISACAQLADDPEQVIILLDARDGIKEVLAQLQARAQQERESSSIT